MPINLEIMANLFVAFTSMYVRMYICIMHLLSIYSSIHYLYHKRKLLIATYICVCTFNSNNMPMELVY